MGQQRIGFVLITSDAVYLLRNGEDEGGEWSCVYVCHMCHSSYVEGIEGLYSKELGIRYTEFEHVVVGHVRSCEHHVNIM